jgi:hypothetical protein
MALDEKRKHSRIESVNLLNYIHCDDHGEELEQGMGRTLNISESGILLETHNRIDVTHVVSLTIGFKEEVIEIKGRTIYLKSNAQGMFESGIEFFDVDDASRKVLQSYIQAFHSRCLD